MRGPPAERSTPALLSFGVVNLDKPPGPSAHEVAGWVRDAVDDALRSGTLDGPAGRARRTGGTGGSTGDTGGSTDDGDGPAGIPPGIDRAAHGGTLDPKVTGCLPVLLGDATRLAQVLHHGRKEYVAVLELHAEPPGDFEAVVDEFEAPLYQKPPRKSAVARELRVREIYDLDVLEVRDRRALLQIRCEGGTYVRKLCHDLGLALGTGAHMGDLRRIGTDPFDDRDLVTMEALVDALAFAREGATSTASEDEAAGEAPIDVRDVVAPAERALEHLPRLTIAESAAREVAEGAPVYAPGVVDVDEAVDEAVDGVGLDGGGPDDSDSPLVACYTPAGAVVCLARLVGDPDADSGTVASLERVLV